MHTDDDLGAPRFQLPPALRRSFCGYTLLADYNAPSDFVRSQLNSNVPLDRVRIYCLGLIQALRRAVSAADSSATLPNRLPSAAAKECYEQLIRAQMWLFRLILLPKRQRAVFRIIDGAGVRIEGKNYSTAVDATVCIGRSILLSAMRVALGESPAVAISESKSLALYMDWNRATLACGIPEVMQWLRRSAPQLAWDHLRNRVTMEVAAVTRTCHDGLPSQHVLATPVVLDLKWSLSADEHAVLEATHRSGSGLLVKSFPANTEDRKKKLSLRLRRRGFIQSPGHGKGYSLTARGEEAFRRHGVSH